MIGYRAADLTLRMSGSYDYHQQLESSLMEFAGRGQEYLARIMLARKTSLTIQSIDRDVSAIHLSIIENARPRTSPKLQTFQRAASSGCAFLDRHLKDQYLAELPESEHAFRRPIKNRKGGFARSATRRAGQKSLSGSCSPRGPCPSFGLSAYQVTVVDRFCELFMVIFCSRYGV